jgi:hypothetical protein
LPPRNAFYDAHGEECGLFHFIGSIGWLGQESPHEVGARVVSLHQDTSTVTGEEVVIFTLASVPVFRETKTK